MKRAPLTVVAVVCLAMGVALGVWKTSQPEVGADAEGQAARDHGAPSRSKWFWQDDEPSAEAVAAPVAEPRVRTIRFITSTGAAVVGARVRAFTSSLLASASGQHGLLECDDFQHLTELAASLRAGDARPRLLGEAVTDETGAAAFAAQAWPRTVVLTVEAPGAPPFRSVETFGRDEIELPDDVQPGGETLLNVFDGEGRPVPSRATIANLATGEVLEERTDSRGTLRARVAGGLVAVFEAEGYFPVVISLEDAGDELPVLMSRPGVVEVTAPASMGAFRVKLVKRHSREMLLRDGRARFELQRSGFTSAEVVEPGLMGAAEGQLDEGSRVVLALQVKRAGRLLVTVVSDDGMPVPLASAVLTAPTTTVDAEAAEEGARLVLGPLGEGPAVLSVSAPGFRTRSQSVELRPGDTDLEVVLRKAATLRGRVVNGQGQPVAEVMVQVRDDAPSDPGGAVTAEDGTFSLHVEEEGAWLIEANGPEGEFARATAQVPGPDAVLTLEPLGAAIVTVIGGDGKPAEGARVMLASAESPEPDFGETAENGELQFEQLVPGEYRLEVDDGLAGERFLRHHEELHVRSGETRRVVVRMRASVALEATVVDATGAPLPFALISVKGDASRSAETDERGVFSMPGFEPGASVALDIAHESAVALTPPTARAGARKTVLRAVSGEHTTGRVVDEQGAPVQAFIVNGVDFSAADGRFDVMVNARGRIVVESLPGASLEVEVKGRRDVGDVVLKQGALVSGVVMDESRQPLASVRLVSPGFVDAEVLSDAEGRFAAEVVGELQRVSISARHGDLGALVEVAVSQERVEVVLTPPTRVEGLVRGMGGRGLTTAVIARGVNDEQVQVDTDAEGRFTLALPQGLWLFGTRAQRSSVSVRITGRAQRVELGAPAESCELEVRGRPLPSMVTLVPESSDWTPVAGILEEFDATAVPPGAVALGLDAAAFVGRGLECGRFVVHAAYGTQLVSVPVTLSRGPNTVSVNPPSLASVGDELGLRRVPITPYELPVEPGRLE